MEKSVAAAIASLLLVSCLFAIFSSSSPSHNSKSQLPDTELTELTATCTADTGGTCLIGGCDEWRKHTTCSMGKCVCPSGMCAFQGTCITQAELSSVPPPPPVCKPLTGEGCAIFDCSKKSNSVCSGFSMGFSSLPTAGQCMCKVGQCAGDDGVCRDAPQFFKPRKLENKKIICPVLSAIWSAGDFKTDQLGRVERIDVQKGIVDGTAAAEAVGFGFAETTAGYRANDPDEQAFSMFPVTKALQEFVQKVKKAPKGEERYLNLFTMLQSKDVLHYIAAAVRGGPIDPACKGYPCASRFGTFFGQFAKNGSLCTAEFGNIASNIYQNGYHGVAADRSLFTTIGGSTFREFAALAGFLVVFGKPIGGWPKTGDLCMSLEDAKWLELKGTFPPGWKKHPWDVPDLMPVLNKWRQQKVKGLSANLAGQSALWSLMQMAKNAVGK